MTKVVTFGEIMLRLSPVGKERLSRGDVFEKRPGGSEFNVLCGLSVLGCQTAMITKFPPNEIRNFIVNAMRTIGVDDRYVIDDTSSDARVGVYYLEAGASPRKPSVIYDRKNSSATRFRADELESTVFGNTRLFHTSGITLALSEDMCIQATEAIKRFKDAGAHISFDINYRANLWSEEKAKAARPWA